MDQPKSYNTSVAAYKPFSTNMSVPTNIKCVRCGTVKNPGSFAKNRLDDLKNEIAKKGNDYNAAKQAYIPCSQCVGAQVVELFCVGCDKWKGLDSFSKAQRRTPDKAKCWPCMEEQQNMEPGASSDDDDSASNSDSDSDESQGGTTLEAKSQGGTTLAGPLSKMSITSGGTSSTGGVALASPTPSNTGTVTPSKTSALAPHLRGQGSPSVNSGNSKFPKPQVVTRKVYSDAAQREREREMALDDDVKVASSDSESE